MDEPKPMVFIAAGAAQVRTILKNLIVGAILVLNQVKLKVVGMLRIEEGRIVGVVFMRGGLRSLMEVVLIFSMKARL